MKQLGWHFLKADMTAGEGNEPSWAIGETRTLTGGEIEPCAYGYHASPTPFDALQYAPGPVLCRVELSGRVIKSHGNPVDKYAARTRTLIAARDISRELRLFACECVERVLPLFEAEYPGDNRPSQAIEVARRYANGEATQKELATYAAAAHAAYAAHADAYAATYAATYAAYADAAYAAYAAAAHAAHAAHAAAAHAAERAWQRERFNALCEELINA